MNSLKLHVTLLLIGLSIIGLILLGCSNQQVETKTGVETEDVKAVQVAENIDQTIKPGKSNGKSPRLVFEELTHDFGKKTSGPELKHIFKFKNEGESTLIIEKVKAG